jgi:hypothetical protein
LHLLAEKDLRCETVESGSDGLVENLRMIEEKREKFRAYVLRSGVGNGIRRIPALRDGGRTSRGGRDYRGSS